MIGTVIFTFCVVQTGRVKAACPIRCPSDEGKCQLSRPIASKRCGLALPKAVPTRLCQKPVVSLADIALQLPDFRDSISLRQKLIFLA
jgi:hypothetical protein